MMRKKLNYNCWFLINPDEPIRSFESLEQSANQIFLEFIKNKDYGKGIKAFRFAMYVKPGIEYALQSDGIFSEYAHLALHIDKSTFDLSDEKGKLILLLNASLILTRYFVTKVPLPKHFHAGDLISDYENYLSGCTTLLPEARLSQIMFKHFETTRFNFLITQAIEVDKRNIHFDLMDIQEFINNRIAGKVFGTSVAVFDFGFELYDFNGGFANFLRGTQQYKRYGIKYRNYLVVKHFDYSQIKDLGRAQQFRLIKDKILEGINDFDALSKKPKDFRKDDFYKVIDTILTEYESSMHDN